MTAAFVDEGGPPAGGLVQLQPVRRPVLGELLRPEAHPLLPLARRERFRMGAHALDDLRDAARAAEVGAETGEAVVDDMRVRIVEPGQDCAGPKLDHWRERSTQPHDLGPAHGDHQAARNREVGVHG